MYGEVIGGLIFFTIVLIQQDKALRFTEDIFEENILLTLAYEGAR
jgi:hypothetical protein